MKYLIERYLKNYRELYIQQNREERRYLVDHGLVFPVDTHKALWKWMIENKYETNILEWPYWIIYEGAIPSHITEAMYMLYCRYAIQKKKGARGVNYCKYCPIILKGKAMRRKNKICTAIKNKNRPAYLTPYLEALTYYIANDMYNAEIREGTEVLPIRLRIQ